MRHCLPILLIVLLLELSARAQTNPQQIDSLRKQGRQYQKSDTVRAGLLIELANALTTIAPNEALQHTEEALALAQMHNWPLGEASAYRQLGNIYTSLTNYGKALENGFKALKAADKLPPGRSGTSLFRASVYSNMGIVHMAMGDLDKAAVSYANYLNVVKQLIEVNKIRDPGLERQRGIALMNLGEVHARKRNFVKADTYSKQSLQIAEASNDYQMSAYVLNSRGLAYINRKQPELAVESLEKGLAYAEKSGDLQIKANLLGAIADVLFDLERYDESVKYGKEGLKIAKALNQLELQRELARVLAYAYIGQKNSQAAVNYLDSNRVLTDSILSADKKVDLARMEERFEREKQEAVLKTQFEADLNQQRIVRNSIAGGAGMLLLASIMSFLFYKRKRDADEQVKTERFSALMSDTELKVLRSQIDPHFISNALNSISNYVLKNDPFTADRYLVKFASLMRAILENSDRKEVPLVEDMETLSLYIELEKLRLDHRFTYQIEIDPALDQERTLIPPLLLQPFVENSIWHGLAGKESDGLITIRIRQEGELMVCTVTDNGIGRRKAIEIKQEKPERKSRGMSITQARIEIINRLKQASGYVTLSDLTEGTEVAVVLPLAIA